MVLKKDSIYFNIRVLKASYLDWPSVVKGLKSVGGKEYFPAHVSQPDQEGSQDRKLEGGMVDPSVGRGRPGMVDPSVGRLSFIKEGHFRNEEGC